MAKRYIGKNRSAQGRANAKADIARLRKLGLVSKGQGKTAASRVKLRTKFRDVLLGKSTVVKLPKSEAKKVRKAFRTKGDRVIVPHQKGERIRVDKAGRITSTRTVGGERVRKIIHLGGRMPKPRKGKKFMYAVSFAGGSRVRYDSLEALQDFMGQYDPKDPRYVSGNFTNWKQFLEIEEVDADEKDGEE